MSDIAKAWTGIGEIKVAMTGLERRMNAYRKENTRQRTPSDPVLDISSDRSTQSVMVDNVPRYVLRAEEDNEDRRTSSPIKQPIPSGNLFNDVESVSTINSVSRSMRDPVKMQEGMMKLKEKVIRQKEMALSASNNAEVRYLDPKNYNSNKPSHPNTRDIRKRKRATAPIIETYKGFNEAQKPVRKHVSIAPEPVSKYVPEQPRTQEPPRRKVASAPADKNTIITTSSWRHGAALTRKVLGNKTQDTDTSTSSITSNTSTNKDSPKLNATKPKFADKHKPKNKVKKKEVPIVTKKPEVPRLAPRPIKKKPVEDPLPKVKARHYDPGEVQKYIENTKKQRKKAEADEKMKNEQAEKEKEKRLQELFSFQKKALKKRGSRSTPSPTKKRSDSAGSDKENTHTSPPSPPVQDPGPGKPIKPSEELKSVLTEPWSVQEEPQSTQEEPQSTQEEARKVTFITQPLPSENDLSAQADVTEAIVVEGEKSEGPDLLPSYLQKSTKDSESRAVYSEQRRRMEAIRATALALRQKIYEETNRLTEEASRANKLLRPLAGYQEYKLPGKNNIKEAWTSAKDTAKDSAKDSESIVSSDQDSKEHDDTLIDQSEEETEVESLLLSTGASFRNQCPFETSAPPSVVVEPFEFPLTADPYSIINIYARQRQREEERINLDRRKEEEKEEEAAQRLRREIEELERDKRREEKELKLMEEEVVKEEERLAELRRRREERSSLSKSISVGSLDSYNSGEEDIDTRNTESLLQTTASDISTPEIHTDYNFTPSPSPLKDISLVSASSAKKSLSFSEHDSVLKSENDTSHPEPNQTGLYSPAALHRKLRGELARYDTYSLSLEHVNTLQHTQQHADAQQDTVALAAALRSEDTKHETELAQLQEKLKRDMAEFQEKLNQVQTQTVLQRADLMNQQAESHAKTAQAVLDATDKLATTHEETNRVLVSMAKRVTETQDAIQKNRLNSPDNTKHSGSAASYTPYTPTAPVLYTPSYTTPYETYTSAPQDVHTPPTPDKTLTTEKTLEESMISEELAPTKDVSSDILESPQRTVEETPQSAYDATPQSAYDSTPQSAYDGTPQSTYDDEDVSTSSPEKVQESFKALLPSESHRRRMSLSEESTASQPRQDSFTTFTMAQVHEYIKNESVRAKHQNTLLALRERALKEKTDVKLKWLEIKKKRIQRKGADDKMPPLLQKERDILAALASEQEEIKKLQEVQRAAQLERKRMLYQQREISAIQHRTAVLRKRIRCAESSNSDISDISQLHAGYDTDGSSIYDEDPRIRSLAEFNQRIQNEGKEVKKLLDQALREKRETEKIEHEFGISSPSRLPRGIQPISTSSGTSTLRDTTRYASPRSSFESSTPVREGSVPPSPAYSLIEGDRVVASEVLEMEERVDRLKEELALKKAEARKLLKEQQNKKKEALRIQEVNLRKQIHTVTGVIEKQKKQIHNKFRSPASSPDKRQPRAIKYSSDESSQKTSSVSEIKSSDRSPEKSSEISEYLSKEDILSKSEMSSGIIEESGNYGNSDITVSSSSTKEISEEIKLKAEISEKLGSEIQDLVPKKQDPSYEEEDLISEDLSKNSYVDLSFNKLQNVKILELEEEMSIGGKTQEERAFDENVRSIEELETSYKAQSDSISSDKLSLFSLKDASALLEGADALSPNHSAVYGSHDLTPPIAESPQPSLHISVDVLEDLSLSSGSLNDTDYSLQSFKEVQKSETHSDRTPLSDKDSTKVHSKEIAKEITKVQSYTELSSKIEEDISEEILEDISEDVVSGHVESEGSSNHVESERASSNKLPSTSSKLQSAKKMDLEIERSVSEVSSIPGKSVSEKLAELQERLSPHYSKISERASMRSYTLSFEEEEDETDHKKTGSKLGKEEDDLLSLLSNIDESLNKSSEILPSPKSNVEDDTPRGHTFSNLTALSSTTGSTDTGETTKQSEPAPMLVLSPQILAPSPPSRHISPLDRLVAERSQSLRQTSFRAPSMLESEIPDDISIEAETADDVEDISLNQSLSDSKTMSELKELISETPSNKTLSHSNSPVAKELLRLTIFSDPCSEETLAEDSTISDDNKDSEPSGVSEPSGPSIDSVISVKSVVSVNSPNSEPIISQVASVPSVLSIKDVASDTVVESLFQQLLKGAFEKMLRVRHNKKQKQLNSSPKYMERSPPEKRLDPTLNDTFRDSELESALALARCVSDGEGSMMSPELPPPPKVTVQCNPCDTLAMATAVTQHLVRCVRNKRPCNLDTFTHCQHLPPNLTPSEQIQARTFQSLIYKTTVECFNEVNEEYNFISAPSPSLPPWRPETRRQPRPYWMKELPPQLDLDSVENYLPSKIVSLIGLSDTESLRKYQHMENILTQEVRDEEAEWTDYDADELAVKFRLSDTIFDCLLRETLAVFSAIEQREDVS